MGAEAPPVMRTPPPPPIVPRKVAANVILGRSHLGVHYRMDGVYGAEMGEAGAIRRLQQVHYPRESNTLLHSSIYVSLLKGVRQKRDDPVQKPHPLEIYGSPTPSPSPFLCFP